MYTPNINNCRRQNLVLESISNLRTSKITFDLGFRIDLSIMLGNPADCWNWWFNYTTTLHQHLCQHVFGNTITILLRQKLRLNLFLNMYALARKYYIHNVLLLEFIPIITCQLQEMFFFSGINFPKMSYHVFVCDSKNYMEKLFGKYFLENLISVTWNNVFGINFAIHSGWRVMYLGEVFITYSWSFFAYS